ncbi:MAG: protease modulator HflC [Acetobacteraceae bacterium]|nr:protease modulator HflC [Acetobacteraceae bacterium]
MKPPNGNYVRRPKTLGRIALSIATVTLGAWAIAASLCAIDTTEYGVVTRFGKVVRIITEPGLYAKAPIDNVIRLDRRLLFSRPAPAEYLTIDKKNIVVEAMAVWSIADPELFLRTLRTRAGAEARLADIASAEIGAMLGRYPSAALISVDPAANQYPGIVAAIHDRIAGFALPAYGIEVVDIDILSLSLPEQNRDHVFERMKAERGRMAKEFRANGEREAKKIIAEAEREKARIETDAYAEAARYRGEGDASAAAIYASAFIQDPDFYKFQRTLHAYEVFLDENTTVFLPEDAELFRVLHQDRKISPSTPGPLSPPATAAGNQGRSLCANLELVAPGCSGKTP